MAPFHKNEPPREPPPDAWVRIGKFAKKLYREIQLQHGKETGIDHTIAAGTLAAGVAFMKATSATEEQVINIVRKLYRDTTFRWMQ